jgi:Flp pilus assembly protein TadB
MMPDPENFDLRARVVSVEQTAASNTNRIATLENWRMQADISDARRGEQWTNLTEKFAGMDKKIDKIEGMIGRIAWLIIGAVILAIIGFMVRGGFNIQ